LQAVFEYMAFAMNAWLSGRQHPFQCHGEGSIAFTATKN